MTRVYLTRKKKAVLDNIGDGQISENRQFENHVLQDEISENVDKRDGFLSSAEDKTQMNSKGMICCVCNLECDGFHMCIMCDQFAHATFAVKHKRMRDVEQQLFVADANFEKKSKKTFLCKPREC